MRSLTTLMIAISLALLLIGVACEPTSDVDHFAIAKEMEAKLPNVGDYGDPAYQAVADELSLVQTGDPTYDQARAWQKTIQRARQDALFARGQAPEVQEGGSHPSMPSAGSGGGSGSKPAGSWTAAGWLPYNNVPTNPMGSSASSASSSSMAAKRAAGKQSSSKCVKGPVVLYGTSWCGVCREARAFFKKKGVSFVDKDVEADASAMSEMKRKAPAASSYPVIDLGGEIMPGFSAQAIERKMCL